MLFSRVLGGFCDMFKTATAPSFPCIEGNDLGRFLFLESDGAATIDAKVTNVVMDLESQSIAMVPKCKATRRRPRELEREGARLSRSRELLHWIEGFQPE